MQIPKINFTRHRLSAEKYINIEALVRTSNALRTLKYYDEYNITSTKCRSDPLKESVMAYYKNKGICKFPIVVTDDDYCLDGRHRIAFLKESNNMICPAYVVPREYINKFIKNY